MRLSDVPPPALVVIGLIAGMAFGLLTAGAIVRTSPVGDWGPNKRTCEKHLPRTQQCVMQWLPDTQAQDTPKATAKED